MTAIDRREFTVMSTLLAFGSGTRWRPARDTEDDMYGLISRIDAVDGAREELAEILLEGVAEMPGCLSYVVAEDAEDENALWVTEVWDSETRHEEALSLPSVQEAMRKGRPLIEGFGRRHVTAPVGGHGLRGP